LCARSAFPIQSCVPNLKSVAQGLLSAYRKTSKHEKFYGSLSHTYIASVGTNKMALKCHTHVAAILTDSYSRSNLVQHCGTGWFSSLQPRITTIGYSQHSARLLYAADTYDGWLTAFRVECQQLGAYRPIERERERESERARDYALDITPPSERLSAHAVRRAACH